MTSTADIETLTHALAEYLKSLDFWQFYVLDVKAERERVREALSADKITPWDGPNVAGKTAVEHFQILKDSGKIIGYRGLTGRFSTKVDGSVAAGFVKAAFAGISDIGALADEWIKVVDVINVSLYEEWDEDTKVASENIKNRLKYTRLDDNGPKLGLISEKCVLSRLRSVSAHHMQVPSRGTLLYSPAWGQSRPPEVFLGQQRVDMEREPPRKLCCAALQSIPSSGGYRLE